MQALRGAFKGAAVANFGIAPAWAALRATRGHWTAATWAREWAVVRQTVLASYLAQGAPLIYGHLPLTVTTRQKHDPQRRFITVLRDPVERFFSNYRYDRIGPGIRPEDAAEPTHPHALEAEFDQFLASDEAVWLAREQLVMLSGVTGEDFYRPEVALRDAQENLRAMATVGFADRLDQFATTLNQLLGTPISFAEANTASSLAPEAAAYDQLLTPPRRARIAELCADEIELVNWARQELP